jgi:hypothetical protein
MSLLETINVLVHVHWRPSIIVSYSFPIPFVATKICHIKYVLNFLD